MNTDEKEAMKSDWLKPLASAIIGGVFSGGVMLMQLHTDVAVMKARMQSKTEAIDMLVVEVKELRKEVSLLRGRSGSL